MKLVAVVLVAGCMDASSGIAGDTSPDDPTNSPDETTGDKSDKPPEQITRGKGVVMAAPTVVHVYWGSYWTGDAGTADRAVIDGFTAMVGGASWWNILAEYPDANRAVGVPVAGAPALILDSEPPAKLYAKDVALHALLASQLTSGVLGYDAETLYVVLTPPGTTGIRGECGHHSYFSVNLPEGRRKVIYALVPYLDDGDKACGVGVDVNGGTLDSITVTLGHEIAEAASDPYLDAWMTADGVEIADQCDTGIAATWGGARFAVQDLWSNASSSCVH